MRQRQKHIPSRCSNQGFTMVELLVAMVVSLLALAAIYSTFQSQHLSYQIQRETSDMQQNIRTAMYYMQREIRMAGSNPLKSLPFSSFGITAAGQNSITFTEDVRGPDVGAPPVPAPPDGDVNDPDENITYNFFDSDGDGTNDCINRNGQTVAHNIDALDFVYLDSNGAVTATLANIRSVEITIVARTKDQLLFGGLNSNPYFNQQGTQILAPQNDNVSRRSLTTLIHCRNLGL